MLLEAFQAAILSMCTIHNEQLKFARKVTLPHSCFLSYPLYVSPSPPSRNWLQKSLSEKHEKLLTESKKKMGNNTLRWSEKKCEQQVKVAFQADPPSSPPLKLLVSTVAMNRKRNNAETFIPGGKCTANSLAKISRTVNSYSSCLRSLTEQVYSHAPLL